MTDKDQAARLRKTRFAMRRAQRHLPKGLPPLLALTDPARTPDPLALARALPQGSGLIYRHFADPQAPHIARALVRIAASHQLFILIGNDPGLASQSGAHGVHWAEADLGKARHWQSRFAIMTCAAHSRSALVRAAHAGMDAALLSAVFPSQSHSAGKPMGAYAFRKYARIAGLPLYALGGLNSETMGKIAHSGGIAAIEGAEVFMPKTKMAD